MAISPERHLRRRAALPNNIWSKSHVIPKRPWREGSYESAEPAQTHPGVALLFTLSTVQAVVRSLTG